MKKLVLGLLAAALVTLGLVGTPSAAQADPFPKTEFGRSGDGLVVACVADTAFAMLPARDGRHYLATAWRISRPLTEWRRSDFYGHSGELADEAAFLGPRVRVLMARLEHKDASTEQHTRRVAEWAVQIGEELGLAPGRLRELALAGQLAKDLKVSLVTDEAPNRLVIRAEVSGLPKYRDVLPLIRQSVSPRRLTSTGK